MRYRPVRLPRPQAGRHHRNLRRPPHPAEVTIHVIALAIELHLPQCHSLKEKRSQLRPVLEGLRNRFSVAASETDHHDTWQRATIGVAAVSGSVRQLEEVADSVERFVWSFPELTVLDARRSWLEDE